MLAPTEDDGSCAGIWQDHFDISVPLIHGAVCGIGLNAVPIHQSTK